VTASECHWRNRPLGPAGPDMDRRERSQSRLRDDLQDRGQQRRGRLLRPAFRHRDGSRGEQRPIGDEPRQSRARCALQGDQGAGLSASVATSAVPRGQHVRGRWLRQGESAATRGTAQFQAGRRHRVFEDALRSGAEEHRHRPRESPRPRPHRRD